MADRIINQIKSIYGEILGIADHVPAHAVPSSVIDLYNDAIDRLMEVSSERNYGRFRILGSDGVSRGGRILYSTASTRPRMTAVLSALEYTYGFSKTQRGEVQQTPMIVTIHNSNQVNVSVTPIQEIIEQLSDEYLRKDVEELRSIIEGSKDTKQASSLLSRIQERSWDVFIALLPVVLQSLGNLPPSR